MISVIWLININFFRSGSLVLASYILDYYAFGYTIV